MRLLPRVRRSNGRDGDAAGVHLVWGAAVFTAGCGGGAGGAGAGVRGDRALPGTPRGDGVGAGGRTDESSRQGVHRVVWAARVELAPARAAGGAGGRAGRGAPAGDRGGGGNRLG